MGSSVWGTASTHQGGGGLGAGREAWSVQWGKEKVRSHLPTRPSFMLLSTFSLSFLSTGNTTGPDHQPPRQASGCLPPFPTPPLPLPACQTCGRGSSTSGRGHHTLRTELMILKFTYRNLVSLTKTSVTTKDIYQTAKEKGKRE